MRRRSPFAALVAVVILALAVPAGFAAVKKRTVRFASTVQAAAVAPAAGGGTVVAGTITDRRLGDGAAVYRTTATQNGVQTATFTTFFDRGTFRGRATVRVTPQPDGSVRLEGEGRITKGTGIYKGAKGAFDIGNGTISAAGSIAFRATGRVRY